VSKATKRSILSSVCLFVCLSVTLCIVAFKVSAQC